MSFSLLGWLFALGVVIHNTEEALFLPAWSTRAGRWHVQVGTFPFRFAVVVLSIAVIFAAWLSSVSGAHSYGAYFLTGYALAMVLNVLFPHVLATVALHSYAPGTATAVLLNLPLGSYLIYRSLTEGYVDQQVFAVSGPATVVGIIASIPILFTVGKKLTHPSSGTLR
ncbi:HXXEE domain-containing protein [Methylomonas rhizoryzae]|uniref:HXXEE domain-containing protein n=1 Tax=Methylomonas rhizoryzae TaxID=2608981 RepID=UPI001231B230|nr:HXXEE domain-containing protein [Methylomonas rhizoryzae]